MVEMVTIPFGNRYYQMARAERFLALDAEIANALRPESDFDRQESASWLNELFDLIREVRLADLERGFHY